MFTRFPGGPVQPLLHLSENASKKYAIFPDSANDGRFFSFRDPGVRSVSVRWCLALRSVCRPRKEPDLCRFRGNENGTTRGPSVFQAERGSIVGLAHTSIYRLCTISVGAYRRTDTARAFGIILFLKQTSSEPVFRWQAVVFRCRLLSCLLAGRNKDSAVEKRMQRCRFSQRIGRIWVSDFMAKYSA